MEEFKNTGQFFFLSPLSYFSFLILPSSSLSLFLLLKYNFPILSSLSLFSYIFFFQFFPPSLLPYNILYPNLSLLSLSLSAF